MMPRAVYHDGQRLNSDRIRKLTCAIVAVTSLFLQAVPAESCSAFSIVTPNITYHSTLAISTKIVTLNAIPPTPPPPSTPYASHSYLAGVGLRSTLNMGLSEGFEPAKIWGSVSQGLLQGVTNIGLNFATQELGLNPLLANIGFSAISGAINAGIQAATGGSQNVFQTLFQSYEKNALTFLGYSDPNSPGYAWQQAAYISQILDFSDIVRERGLTEALNTYGASFFNAVAVNNIVQSGASLGQYFADKLQAGQYTVKVDQKTGTEYKEVGIGQEGEYGAGLFTGSAETGWTLSGRTEAYGDTSFWGFGDVGVDAYGKMGFTDAELATVYNGIWRENQTIDGGLQVYADVCDLHSGDTLLTVTPKDIGGWNIYNDGGEYVDAMISAPGLGLEEEYLFDNGVANYYQEDADIGILGDDGNILTDVDATLRVTFDENGNVKNRELVVGDGFSDLFLSEDGILLLNQFGNETYIPFKTSALSPSPNTKKVLYILHNGIFNPQREGIAPHTTRRFKDELVRQGVNEKTIFLEPVYEREERGKPREDIQRWLKDSLFNEDVIADEIFQKYLAVYQALTPEERIALKVGVTYSGSFNPYLRAIEKYNMNIETIVNYGGQSIKGVFSGYEINNTYIKNVINIWGENDFYGKLVQEKNFTNVNMINIELKIY